MLVLNTESFLNHLDEIVEGWKNGEERRHEDAIEWFSQMKNFHKRSIDDIICFAWEDYYDWDGPDEEMKKAWDDLENNPAFEIVYHYYSGRLYEIQSALMRIYGIDFKEL